MINQIIGAVHGDNSWASASIFTECKWMSWWPVISLVHCRCSPVAERFTASCLRGRSRTRLIIDDVRAFVHFLSDNSVKRKYINPSTKIDFPAKKKRHKGKMCGESRSITPFIIDQEHFVELSFGCSSVNNCRSKKKKKKLFELQHETNRRRMQLLWRAVQMKLSSKQN